MNSYFVLKKKWLMDAVAKTANLLSFSFSLYAGYDITPTLYANLAQTYDAESIINVDENINGDADIEYIYTYNTSGLLDYNADLDVDIYAETDESKTIPTYPEPIYVWGPDLWVRVSMHQATEMYPDMLWINTHELVSGYVTGLNALDFGYLESNIINNIDMSLEIGYPDFNTLSAICSYAEDIDVTGKVASASAMPTTPQTFIVNPNYDISIEFAPQDLKQFSLNVIISSEQVIDLTIDYPELDPILSVLNISYDIDGSMTVYELDSTQGEFSVTATYSDALLLSNEMTKVDVANMGYLENLIDTDILITADVTIDESFYINTSGIIYIDLSSFNAYASLSYSDLIATYVPLNIDIINVYSNVVPADTTEFGYFPIEIDIDNYYSWISIEQIDTTGFEIDPATLYVTTHNLYTDITGLTAQSILPQVTNIETSYTFTVDADMIIVGFLDMDGYIRIRDTLNLTCRPYLITYVPSVYMKLMVSYVDMVATVSKSDVLDFDYSLSYELPETYVTISEPDLVPIVVPLPYELLTDVELTINVVSYSETELVLQYELPDIVMTISMPEHIDFEIVLPYELPEITMTISEPDFIPLNIIASYILPDISLYIENTILDELDVPVIYTLPNLVATLDKSDLEQYGGTLTYELPEVYMTISEPILDDFSLTLTYEGIQIHTNIEEAIFDVFGVNIVYSLCDLFLDISELQTTSFAADISYGLPDIYVAFSEPDLRNFDLTLNYDLPEVHINISEPHIEQLIAELLYTLPDVSLDAEFADLVDCYLITSYILPETYLEVSETHATPINADDLTYGLIDVDTEVSSAETISDSIYLYYSSLPDVSVTFSTPDFDPTSLTLQYEIVEVSVNAEELQAQDLRITCSYSSDYDISATLSEPYLEQFTVQMLYNTIEAYLTIDSELPETINILLSYGSLDLSGYVDITSPEGFDASLSYSLPDSYINLTHLVTLDADTEAITYPTIEIYVTAEVEEVPLEYFSLTLSYAIDELYATVIDSQVINTYLDALELYQYNLTPTVVISTPDDVSIPLFISSEQTINIEPTYDIALGTSTGGVDIYEYNGDMNFIFIEPTAFAGNLNYLQDYEFTVEVEGTIATEIETYPEPIIYSGDLDIINYIKLYTLADTQIYLDYDNQLDASVTISMPDFLEYALNVSYANDVVSTLTAITQAPEEIHFNVVDYSIDYEFDITLESTVATYIETELEPLVYPYYNYRFGVNPVAAYSENVYPTSTSYSEEYSFGVFIDTMTYLDVNNMYIPYGYEVDSSLTLSMLVEPYTEFNGSIPYDEYKFDAMLTMECMIAHFDEMGGNIPVDMPDISVTGGVQYVTSLPLNAKLNVNCVENFAVNISDVTNLNTNIYLPYDQVIIDTNINVSMYRERLFSDLSSLEVQDLQDLKFIDLLYTDID